MTIDVWQILKNLLPALWSSWPLWAILLLLLGVRLAFEFLAFEIDGWRIQRKFRQGEKWRTEREMIGWLRQMSSSDFEKYIADIFQRLGYTTNVTGGAYDGGVDIIAEKEGRKYYIQCKRYSVKHEVGAAAIREFYGALADRMTNVTGYIVTTGKFTLAAKRFAEDKPVELVDSHRLLDYIRLANGETNVSEVASAFISMLKCPRDKGELVERVGKYGKFLGCSNYPKCKFTTGIR